MNDMSSTIVAKSDQINAADLVGISRTVTIREVRIKAGDDQPVSILIEGDQKVFRPCKGVRRLLVRVWGPDANKYIGQSMTLFCDPTVTWAGKPEGGIRVSHMTGLDEKIVEFMRTGREKTKPYEILPLHIEQTVDKAAEAADKIIENIGRAPDLARLEQYLAGKPKTILAEMRGDRPELAAKIEAAADARRAELSADDDDPFAEPATPAYASLVADLKAQIQAAKTEAALDKAEKRFGEHRDALPGDVADEIEALVGAQRAGLAS